MTTSFPHFQKTHPQMDVHNTVDRHLPPTRSAVNADPLSVSLFDLFRSFFFFYSFFEKRVIDAWDLVLVLESQISFFRWFTGLEKTNNEEKTLCLKT
jgi:hypothetical protein